MERFPKEFNELTVDEKNLFGSCFESIEISKNTCLFKAGDSADYAIIIDKGAVKFEFGAKESDTKIVRSITNSVLIEESVLFNKNSVRSLSAYADTDLSLYTISYNAFAELIEKNPKLAVKIYMALGSSVANKLNQLNKFNKLNQSKPTLDITKIPALTADKIIENATKAQLELVKIDEKRIDNVLFEISKTIVEKTQDLAAKVVKQTKIGNVADKTIKQRSVCVGTYHQLVGQKGHGIINRKKTHGVQEVMDAMGVIFCLIPITNPVSTACFTSMISLKSRNAIILGPNRIGGSVAIEVINIIRNILKKHNFPVDAIQIIEKRSNHALTNFYMSHKEISLILAIGGSSMVRAAYSSGNPAIGVGPGNVPCLITADADIKHAAKSIVRSKPFDNGIVCGSESNIIVVNSKKNALIKALKKEGAAILSAEEVKTFTEAVVCKETGYIYRMMIGKDVNKIAKHADIKRDYPIKLIIVPSKNISHDNPWSKEKMAPIVSLFTVKDNDEGIKACRLILKIDGSGHTAVIYTHSRKLVEKFGTLIKASRILVNSPAVQGITGLSTGLEPSLILGCGSFGGNSTTDNITYKHLMNVKRIAWFLPYKKHEELITYFSNSAIKILKIIRSFSFFTRLFKH